MSRRRGGRSGSAGPRTLQVDKRTARALREGQVWVFGDSLQGSQRAPACGEIVDLVSPFGEFVARALAEGELRPGAPGLRAFSRDSSAPPLADLLRRRVRAAVGLRSRVLPDGTDAYRLLHGEGDDLPGLVVDRYGPVFVVRPDGHLWDRHLDDITQVLLDCAGPGAGTPISHIVHRSRSKGGPGPRLLHGDSSTLAEEVVAQEAGRRYLVRPAGGQKTGFFLDQRPNRSLSQRLARPGDRALNLFSYTGGFSVAMALGGAASVTSVDLSDAILDDCRRQFPLNGLDPSHHEFVAADVFRWLPRLAADSATQPFDLVVCDPPALSHSKADLPAARRAYHNLHEALAPLVAPGGLLMTCSCTARLDADALLEDATAGLAAGGRRVRTVLHRGGAGMDHPVRPGFSHGDYLSCLVLALDDPGQR